MFSHIHIEVCNGVFVKGFGSKKIKKIDMGVSGSEAHPRWRPRGDGHIFQVPPVN